MNACAAIGDSLIVASDRFRRMHFLKLEGYGERQQHEHGTGSGAVLLNLGLDRLLKA